VRERSRERPFYTTIIASWPAQRYLNAGRELHSYGRKTHLYAATVQDAGGCNLRVMKGDRRSRDVCTSLHSALVLASTSLSYHAPTSDVGRVAYIISPPNPHRHRPHCHRPSWQVTINARLVNCRKSSMHPLTLLAALAMDPALVRYASTQHSPFSDPATARSRSSAHSL